MPKIEKQEFWERLARIRSRMQEQKLDGLMVYGDEYRKENLRYVSNFWPIFERSACFISLHNPPRLAVAPEGAQSAREMSVWDDLCNVRDFACVSVAEEIDYPLAGFTSFKEILGATLGGGKHLGVVGLGDMPAPILERVKQAVPGLVITDAAPILNAMRVVKSPAEIACLREAGRLACVAYKKLMEIAVPGNTELMAAGAAEGAARMAGAENINFTVFGSGQRAGTIIGRATGKAIADGEMIMAAIAIQYQGYVATAEFPFVAGRMSDGQKRFLRVLLEAAEVQTKYLRDGVSAGAMVQVVKQVFEKYQLQQYDVYPPLHGIGLAEAESPYPDAHATYPLRVGMCVNSDISLFGHPDGSNRIEEGFVITQDGPESLTPYIRDLCGKGW